MGIDYKRVYQEFERVKNAKEFNEYSSELEQISRLLNTYPFDSVRATTVCSYLAGKYENEINQQPPEAGEKKTVIKGTVLPPKTPDNLKEDLYYFQTHIPIFALKREIKSEVAKTLLGL